MAAHRKYLNAWWHSIVLALALLATAVPLVVRAVAGPAGAIVNVRWQPTLDSATRQRLEVQFRLMDGEPFADSTWRYDLVNPSSDNIRALIEHPAVADTHHIDRPRRALAPSAVRTERRQRFPAGAGVGVAAGDQLSMLVAALAMLLFVVGATGHASTPQALRTFLAQRASLLAEVVSARLAHAIHWIVGADRNASARRRFLQAAAMGVAAIAYRTASFDGFVNDQYMHLSWARQVVRGAWPGRDFVDPGMPLTIALSALAQLLGGGRIILAEFALCMMMLAAAAALTCWLAYRLTRSSALAMCAAALQIASYPRMYNYPKLVVPLVGLALLWRYVESPSIKRAALAGAWIAVGFLFRHDYLIYLTAGAVAALLAVTRTVGWRTMAVHTAAVAATAFLVVLPYLVGLTAIGDLADHIDDAIEFAGGEAWGETPSSFTLSDPLSMRNAVFALFWASFGLPAVLLVLTLASASTRPSPRGVADARRIVLAVLAIATAFGFMREPVEARLPDAAGLAPLVLVAAVAWLGSFGLPWRMLAGVGLAVAVFAVVVHGGVGYQLTKIGAFSDPTGLPARYVETLSLLQQKPAWAGFWPGDVPRSVRYVNVCTREEDRVLVTIFAPQFFIFADRGFAAGHPYFYDPAYSSPDDQKRMMNWLHREPPPIALIALDPTWFRQPYYVVQQYLDTEYAIVGEDHVFDQFFAVAVRRDRVATSVDKETGWPCFGRPR